MQYRYVQAAADYSHLASGHVLFSVPGAPALPVRLVSEIFQRALACFRDAGGREPVTLYDPCCGGAYHLTVLGLLHGERIREIWASDVDEEVLAIASRNLSLLTSEGQAVRRRQLADLVARYGKQSHSAALVALDRLAEGVQTRGAMGWRVFVADGLNGAALAREVAPGTVSLVVTDVPYGRHSRWQSDTSGSGANETPLGRLLAALHPALAAAAVVAVVSDKGQKAEQSRYRQLQRFRAGKRLVTLLAPR